MYVRRCDRALLAQMKALTRKAVYEELGDYLTSSEHPGIDRASRCAGQRWSSRSGRRRSTTATRRP